MTTVKNCALCGSEFDFKGLMAVGAAPSMFRNRLTELAKRASDRICPSWLKMLMKGELKR